MADNEDSITSGANIDLEFMRKKDN